MVGIIFVFLLPEDAARFAPLQQLLSHNRRCGHVTLGILIELDEMRQDGDKDLAQDHLILVSRMEVDLHEVAQALPEVVVVCSFGVKIHRYQRAQDLTKVIIACKNTFKCISVPIEQCATQYLRVLQQLCEHQLG